LLLKSNNRRHRPVGRDLLDPIQYPTARETRAVVIIEGMKPRKGFSELLDIYVRTEPECGAFAFRFSGPPPHARKFISIYEIVHLPVDLVTSITGGT
jgi:hypothetical protein